MRVRHMPAVLCLLGGALAITACTDAGPSAPEPTPTASRLALRSARSGGGTTTHLTAPVEFTIESGTCGLTTDVHGAGELRANIHVTRTGNGEYVGHYDSKVQGTAAGADGTRYRFSYVTNIRLFDFTVPPGAIPVPVGTTAAFVDNFHLVGQAGAPDIAVQQRLTLVFDANGAPTVLKAAVRGDPGCDPI